MRKKLSIVCFSKVFNMIQLSMKGFFGIPLKTVIKTQLMKASDLNTMTGTDFYPGKWERLFRFRFCPQILFFFRFPACQICK